MAGIQLPKIIQSLNLFSVAALVMVVFVSSFGANRIFRCPYGPPGWSGSFCCCDC